MIFDPEHALRILPALLHGAVVTVQATGGGMAIALVVGMVLATARMVPAGWASLPARLYVDVVRSTPLLIQLFFAFYILPRYVPALDPLLTGILVLGLHYSTYTAEIYRAGIENVPRGQWEAAHALGFPGRPTWTRIVLPQALPPVVPALGNYLIAMFKDSALLATITVVELFGAALRVGAESYRYFEPIALVGLIYFALSYPSALLVQRLERHLAKRSR